MDEFIDLNTVLSNNTTVIKNSNFHDVLKENVPTTKIYQPQVTKNKCVMKFVGIANKIPIKTTKYVICDIEWNFIEHLYDTDTIENTIKIMSFVYKNVIISYQFNVKTKQYDNYTGDFSIMIEYENVKKDLRHFKKHIDVTDVIKQFIKEASNDDILMHIKKMNF